MGQMLILLHDMSPGLQFSFQSIGEANEVDIKDETFEIPDGINIVQRSSLGLFYKALALR